MKTLRLERFPLGNQRFNWRQKDFIVSTFNGVGMDTNKDERVDAVENIMKLCRDCGFDMVEMGWACHGKAWRAVELCDEIGLNVVFQDLSIMGGMMYRLWDRPVEDDTIRAVAKKVSEKKHVIGFYVWDEPYDDVLFAEVRRQSDILKSVCPDALLFSVFPPSYNEQSKAKDGKFIPAFRSYIEKVSPPVISLDHYPVGDYFKLTDGFVYDDGKQLDNALIWYDLAVLRQMSREYDLPFWFYYQAIPIFSCIKKLDFPMARSMACAALLYGAKGLQQYSAGDSVFTAEGEKGPQFDEYRDFHAAVHALGNTLMALQSRGVYHSSDLNPGWVYGKLFDELRDPIEGSLYLAGDLPARTSVAELSDAYGNDYIMVQNRDFYKEGEITVPFKSSVRLYEVSKKDGTMAVSHEDTESLTVTLAPGDIALYRIQPSSEEPFIIEYFIK